ncbi:MAG: DNA-3-methyladenine glycosylase I [Chloroflexota bacterium]|nr:DNA-3-methyladenine glycosylase I [Chloroflexota bacterium]
MTDDAVTTLGAEDGIAIGPDGVPRCWWATSDPLYVAYHDVEWGFPQTDDTRLFEKLCLEGFQAGLSWLVILRKRDAFRAAFDGFDFHRVAGYGASDVERLMADAGIVRNRRKVESTVANARRALELVGEFGSLAAFVWQYRPDPRSRPPRMTRKALAALTSTPESVAMSRELKRRGWSMVGPTTAYAFMQSVGIVNDHLDACATRRQVEVAQTAVTVPGRHQAGDRTP